MPPVQLEAFQALAEVLDLCGEELLREKLMPRLHVLLEDLPEGLAPAVAREQGTEPAMRALAAAIAADHRTRI